MKKKYTLLLITLCFACNTDSNEFTTNSSSQNEYKAHLKSSSSLWSLQTDLMKLYNVNNSNPVLLSDKIALLDSLANSLPEFVNLKSTQYVPITTYEVDDIQNNYDQIYQNLNRAPEFLNILDTIILTDFDFNSIQIEIENEVSFSENEKELLLFIAYNSDDKWDINWKKRRGISIIQGYNLSKAHAVFNAALFSILE